MTEPAGNLEPTETEESIADIVEGFTLEDEPEISVNELSFDDEEEESTPDEGKDDGEKLTAPEHWSAADKELFEAAGDVDPQFQQWLLDKSKDIERDAQTKWQEAAKMRKANESDISLAEQARKILAPIAGRYPAHAGVDEVRALQMMTAWWDGLTNPQTRMAAFADLTRQLGIDMNQSDEDEDVDPAVKQLKAELHQLRASQQQSTSAQQQALYRQQQEAIQQSTQQAQEQLQQFVEAKDESGALKHPHFNAVQKTMGAMLKAANEAGEPIDLDEAYRLAVVHKGLPDESPASRLRKAKRAASGIRTKRGESPPDDDIPLRGLIEGVIDGQFT